MYTENYEKSQIFRREYLNSIVELLEIRRDLCNKKRRKYIENIGYHIENYRKDFVNLLGWPLKEYKKDINDINVRKIFVKTVDNYCISRMQFEIFENYWFYGLFFEKNTNTKKPLIICQHGDLGTPEKCAGIHETDNYNYMINRVLQNDVNVFAPQMLLWDPLKYGDKFDRGQLDLAFKHTGGSLAALELFSLKKVLDYYENNNYILNDMIGMIGLSYGGFFTANFMAVETRIKAGLSCSYFNNRYKTTQIDWKWNNSANYFLDAEMVLLSHPRFLHIMVGIDDELFSVYDAEKEYKRMTDLAKEISFDCSNIKFEIFEGKHEFPESDEALKMLIEKIKY